jgi:hypothetical protein
MEDLTVHYSAPLDLLSIIYYEGAKMALALVTLCFWSVSLAAAEVPLVVYVRMLFLWLCNTYRMHCGLCCSAYTTSYLPLAEAAIARKANAQTSLVSFGQWHCYRRFFKKKL